MEWTILLKEDLHQNDALTFFVENINDAMLPYLQAKKNLALQVVSLKEAALQHRASQAGSAAGVYMLFHKRTQSVYFGESNNLAARASEHFIALALHNHHNAAIRRLSRMGVLSDWIFAVLAYENNPIERTALERTYIQHQWKWRVLNQVGNQQRNIKIVGYG